MLTLCMSVMFYCRLPFFIVAQIFSRFFETSWCVYPFGSCVVGFDLDPNCLLSLSADDKSRHWQAKFYGRAL